MSQNTTKTIITKVPEGYVELQRELLRELKETCTECEICGMPTKFINFPCRDQEDGSLAEITSVCRKCHDQWCNCPCKRTSKTKLEVWID